MFHQARRRQRFRAALSVGCSGSGRSRMLKATAGKTKKSSPEENFESNAPAKTSPNLTTSPPLGECHMAGNCQMVSSQNSVTTTSVITSGPKARNAGIVTYAIRHSRPPQAPPNCEPIK